MQTITTEIVPTDYVAIARTLATNAHAGQFRRHKDGTPSDVPYITHCERVAEKFPDDYEAQAVAWLHDVIEDAHVEVDNLRKAGIPEIVIEAVVCMTKIPGEDYEHDYLDRVWVNALARRVKIRDVIDNLADDPTDKQIVKYSKALQYLVL